MSRRPWFGRPWPRRGALPPSRPSVALAAVLAAIVIVGALFAGAGRAVTGVDERAGAAASASGVPATILPTNAVAGSTSSIQAGTSVTPAPSDPSLVPLVPIVSFWSTQRSISLTQLARVIGRRYPGPVQDATPVAASPEDLDALGSALGVEPLGVKAMAAADVLAFVKATPGAIGIVRAEDVALGVRALEVDGLALFGAARIHRIADWPLLASEPGVPSSFSMATTWTMAAGGDVMLDKAVYAQSILDDWGVDYAWNGGTAVIDSRYCCGWGGADLASGHRTGNQGAVGRLFRESGLGLVNLESPEPQDFTYHADGFSFTGDPELLAGLRDAGIDFASLANNHLGDGGLHAVADETGSLDTLGIAHAGAGANLDEARKAAWLSAGGLRIAVLAYCWIAPQDYWATNSSSGSSGYSIGEITADIASAKAVGADYVVVMPHWGIEYTDAYLPEQAVDAQRMVAAGADLILGSHSHWFGPMQQIGADHLVFYSLGDLVFDWTHDERTQESAVVDLTFSGRRLVQVDLHPTFIIDGQPNLLLGDDGARVFDQLHKTSASLLGW